MEKVRLVPNGGCASWSASSSGLVVNGRRSKSSQVRTAWSRARQKSFVSSTPTRPCRSLRSWAARSSSRLSPERAVADLKRRVEDLEALVELGLGDAERWAGHDRVPPDERVHAGVGQRLADRLHLRRSAIEGGKRLHRVAVAHQLERAEETDR